MRAVALTLSITVLAGCFPENPRARTIAKLTEGGFIVAGIGILAVSQSSADCKPLITGVRDPSCASNANTIGDLGLGLILAGIVGFIATVSTTPDEKTPPVKEIKAPVPKPEPAKPEPAKPEPPAPTAN